MSAESTKRDTICIRYESIIERFPRNYSILKIRHYTPQLHISTLDKNKQ